MTRSLGTILSKMTPPSGSHSPPSGSQEQQVAGLAGGWSRSQQGRHRRRCLSRRSSPGGAPTPADVSQMSADVSQTSADERFQSRTDVTGLRDDQRNRNDPYSTKLTGSDATTPVLKPEKAAHVAGFSWKYSLKQRCILCYLSSRRTC